jgi:hypothetical protein
MDKPLTADPGRGDRVSLAVNSTPGMKSLEWRFWLDGEAITIETIPGQDDGREALARSLAAALGWEFPEPDELQQAA